jgi:hypothetical protein
MITNPFQRKVFDAVSAALPFAIDPAKITVEPGVSYLPSPIKLHDYAAGVMAALGSVVDFAQRWHGDGLAPAQPEMPPAQSVLRCDHTPLSHLATRPITPSSL